MKIRVKKFNINIEYIVIITIISTIAIRDIRSYLYNYYICYLFIAFHEFSHMLVASLLGVKIVGLNIRLNGLNINLEKTSLGKFKWTLIYLAGPLSNVILALIFLNITFIFEINMALALINLIPIHPLDGFNLMDTLLEGRKNKRNIEGILKIIVLTILLILAGIQLMFFRRISLILLVIYLYFLNIEDKEKDDLEIYQKYYKNITNI